MQEVSVRVLAEIELLPLPKREPYRSGARPNHFFPGREWAVIGQLEFPEGQLQFGSRGKATVRFIWPGSWDLPKPGSSWRICEGPKQVGTGNVLEVAA